MEELGIWRLTKSRVLRMSSLLKYHQPLLLLFMNRQQRSNSVIVDFDMETLLHKASNRTPKFQFSFPQLRQPYSPRHSRLHFPLVLSLQHRNHLFDLLLLRRRRSLLELFANQSLSHLPLRNRPNSYSARERVPASSLSNDRGPSQSLLLLLHLSERRLTPILLLIVQFPPLQLRPLTYSTNPSTRRTYSLLPPLHAPFRIQFPNPNPNRNNPRF